MNRIQRPIILWMVLWLVSGGPLWAGYDYRFDQRMVQIGQYDQEVASKLSRGLTNVGLSWTELMRGPAQFGVKPKGNPFKGAVLGVPYGVAKFVQRASVGIYETVTFLAPQRPILDPIQGDVQ